MTEKTTVNKPHLSPQDSYASVFPAIDAFLFDTKAFIANQAFIRECIKTKNTSLKYQGKYAFIRVFHAQEIISAVFSLFAAISAGASLLYVCKKKPSFCKTYSRAVKFALGVHCATWVGSFVFHVRDCYCTQCIDYFGAISSISSSVFLSCVRLSLLQRSARYALPVLVGAHIYYMHWVNFNFGYNAAVCGGLFAVNLLLWCLWYGRVRSQVHSRLLRLSIVGMCISALFQLIDFGPVHFLLDSHAMWHVLGWLFSTSLYVSILTDTSAQRTSKTKGCACKECLRR
ncbi:post-GPI attachment to proteins factor 3 [Nematocida major]|uniref:post-GPI attachment to proteins factor 3 n=1 Tax=Nematocida major TaxID=1912982 RepID=UPI002008B4A8|nr:post-GPI attachment to proteins factor 3 [Nematocida major]KAH9385226.1 post-GPI attachment to proteins factor 3 [Nematocida major]